MALSAFFSSIAEAQTAGIPDTRVLKRNTQVVSLPGKIRKDNLDENENLEFGGYRDCHNDILGHAIHDF